MSKSRRDKSRNQNLLNYKQKHKKKKMENQQLLDANTRSFPVWDSNEKIDMYGAEFEPIFNFINSVQAAYSACGSIVNRNLLEGKIRVKFEKLVGEDYVPMTAEEEAPYQKQLQETITKAKEIATQAVAERQAPQKAERLDAIVNEHGVPYNEADRADEPKLTVVKDNDGDQEENKQ